MIILTNTNQLPADDLHALIVRNEAEAQQKATQYQASWMYKSQYLDICYLYVLNLEWKAKQQEKLAK